MEGNRNRSLWYGERTHGDILIAEGSANFLGRERRTCGRCTYEFAGQGGTEAAARVRRDGWVRAERRCWHQRARTSGGWGHGWRTRWRGILDRSAVGAGDGSGSCQLACRAEAALMADDQHARPQDRAMRSHDDMAR